MDTWLWLVAPQPSGQRFHPRCLRSLSNHPPCRPGIDRASIALAEGTPAGVLKSYHALADHRCVPHSPCITSRVAGPPCKRRPKSNNIPRPQRRRRWSSSYCRCQHAVKYIPSIAFSATRHRSASTRPSKPPGKSWVRALKKRHPELRARRVKAMDWD